MTQEKHRDQHVKLHQALDELLADFLAQHPRKLPSNTSVTELMRWSYRQTVSPAAPKGALQVLKK